MNANEARLKTKASNALGINYQRQHVLYGIKRAAILGDSYFAVNDPLIKLFEEDYLYFENLGYKVIRHNQTPGYIHIPVISW